jgi:SAM-dependent methyltransferase
MDRYLEVMKLVFNGQPSGSLVVLDVGCGVGEQAGVLKSMGHHVVGIDISFNSVKTAREKNEHNDFNTGYIVADAEYLPFKENVFDVCFCGLLFHHFPSLGCLARECYRILRTPGTLFSYDPNGYNPYEFFGYYLIKLVGGVPWKTKNERFLFPKELKTVFGRVGFSKFRISSICLFSQKKKDLFYTLRSIIYKALSKVLPGIAGGNFLVMRCEK